MTIKIACLAVALCLGLATGARADCMGNPSGEEAKTCLGEELRAANARIDAAFAVLQDALDASARANLRADQREWLERRDGTCGLPDSDGVSEEKWLQAALADEKKMICAARFTFRRTAELDTLLKATAQAQAAGLPPAPASPSPIGQANETPSPELVAQDDGYTILSITGHRSSRRYYEVWIDRAAIAKRGDVLLHSGYFSTQNDSVYRATNIRRGQKDTDPINIGWAIDLQKGFAYVRQNGEWRTPPGSEDGAMVRLNREWRMGLRASVELMDLIKAGMVRVNLNGPFEYPVPDGYLPFTAR